MRLFFALWPDNEAAAGLSAVAQEAARRWGGRASRQETLHLTLAFLGEVNPDALPLALAAAADIDCPAFDLCLDHFGHWKHNEIFWLGCARAPEPLRHLAETLSRGLRQRGFALERRAFSPHVTLVRRMKSNPGDFSAFFPSVWQCRSFVLVRSVISDHGAEYNSLADWPLREP